MSAEHMNKLIPSALFSVHDAREQRYRDAKRDGTLPHGDVRDASNSWDRAARGFRVYDPAMRKIAALLIRAKRTG